MKRVSPVLLPEARSFSLDFHPISHRGEDSVQENHYIPCRGQAAPSVQTFFAREHEKQVLCYANAILTPISAVGNRRFTELNLDELPVIGGDDSGKLLGRLRRQDVITVDNSRLMTQKRASVEQS